MTITAQYASLGTVKKLTDAPTTGNAYPANDPSALGNRPLGVFLQADTHDVRFTADGSTPTSSYGTLLVAADEPFFYAGPLPDLRFIEVTSGSKLNVVYSADNSAKGAQGAQGAQGSTGAQGAIGPQGVAGGLAFTDVVTVTAHSVAVNGPLLLQASGGVVLAAFIDNVTLNDRDSGLVIGEVAQIEISSDNGMALVDTDLCWAQYVGPNAAASAAAIPSGLNHAATGDVVALWLTQVTAIPVESAPGSWQALHAYSIGDMILDDQFTPKHFRLVSVAGTSGATVPTWGNFAPTTDGGVTWDDEGRVPATGQMDVRLLVG